MEIVKKEDEIDNFTPEQKGDDKLIFDNAWKTYRNETAKLKFHQSNTYGLLLGQYTKELINKLGHESEWQRVEQEKDPLKMFSLISK